MIGQVRQEKVQMHFKGIKERFWSVFRIKKGPQVHESQSHWMADESNTDAQRDHKQDRVQGAAFEGERPTENTFEMAPSAWPLNWLCRCADPSVHADLQPAAPLNLSEHRAPTAANTTSSLA